MRWFRKGKEIPAIDGFEYEQPDSSVLDFIPAPYDAPKPASGPQDPNRSGQPNADPLRPMQYPPPRVETLCISDKERKLYLAALSSLEEPVSPLVLHTDPAPALPKVRINSSPLTTPDVPYPATPAVKAPSIKEPEHTKHALLTLVDDAGLRFTGFTAQSVIEAEAAVRVAWPFGISGRSDDPNMLKSINEPFVYRLELKGKAWNRKGSQELESIRLLLAIFTALGQHGYTVGGAIAPMGKNDTQTLLLRAGLSQDAPAPLFFALSLPLPDRLALVSPPTCVTQDLIAAVRASIFEVASEIKMEGWLHPGVYRWWIAGMRRFGGMKSGFMTKLLPLLLVNAMDSLSALNFEFVTSIPLEPAGPGRDIIIFSSTKASGLSFKDAYVPLELRVPSPTPIALPNRPEETPATLVDLPFFKADQPPQSQRPFPYPPMHPKFEPRLPKGKEWQVKDSNVREPHEGNSQGPPSSQSHTMSQARTSSQALPSPTVIGPTAMVQKRASGENDHRFHAPPPHVKPPPTQAHPIQTQPPPTEAKPLPTICRPLRSPARMTTWAFDSSLQANKSTAPKGTLQLHQPDRRPSTSWERIARQSTPGRYHVKLMTDPPAANGQPTATMALPRPKQLNPPQDTGRPVQSGGNWHPHPHALPNGNGTTHDRHPGGYVHSRSTSYGGIEWGAQARKSPSGSSTPRGSTPKGRAPVILTTTYVKGYYNKPNGSGPPLRINGLIKINPGETLPLVDGLHARPSVDSGTSSEDHRLVTPNLSVTNQYARGFGFDLHARKALPKPPATLHGPETRNSFPQLSTVPRTVPRTLPPPPRPKPQVVKQPVIATAHDADSESDEGMPLPLPALTRNNALDLHNVRLSTAFDDARNVRLSMASDFGSASSASTRPPGVGSSRARVSVSRPSK